MPPGARAKAHLHESHETAIYVLAGEVDTWYGDELEHHILVKAGDLFYIPAGVPHLPANRSDKPASGDHCPHRSQRAGERRAAAASRRARAGLKVVLGTAYSRHGQGLTSPKTSPLLL